MKMAIGKPDERKFMKHYLHNVQTDFRYLKATYLR